MHYFISTREDYNTSAIELAQVKRMQLFDSLNVPNKIIEIQKNDFGEECQDKLGTKGRVINLFQYFQKLSTEKAPLDPVLDRILNKNGLVRKGNDAYAGKRDVIQTHLYNGRLFYVDYLDQYGFTVKRQFFDRNHLSYIEYFDDQAHLMIREFVDFRQVPVIKEYFCQSQENKPMLTLVELKDGEQEYRFDKIEDLQAYFLDKIVTADSQAVLYCDRCTQVLPAFEKMKREVPRYVVLHSALTPSGNINEEAYTVYQPIASLTQENRLNGVVSSTKQEAKNVAQKFGVTHSYAIPVTFIQKQNELPFKARKKGNVIAVARVDEVKQLDQLIKVIIDLKARYPELELSIYGNNTSNQEMDKLQKMVADNKAKNYIHFCGFAQDLNDIYNNAQLEVLTSKNEGFAMALLEAQAHGVPAVSYDIDYGPNEIIEDGVSGQLLPANDTQKLEETIAHLLAHPEILAEYSANAYQAAQRFDFAHLKEKWQHFLQNEQLI